MLDQQASTLKTKRANLAQFVRSSNILSLHNQSPAIKQAELFADLTEEQKRYSENLLNDWYAKLSLIGGAATSTADSYLSAVKRLLRITRKAPWQLDLHDFPNLLQHSFEVNGRYLYSLFICNNRQEAANPTPITVAISAKRLFSNDVTDEVINAVDRRAVSSITQRNRERRQHPRCY